MKSLFILPFIIAFWLTGCATVQEKVPPGCENSHIYKTIKNPKLIGAMIEIGNLQALKQNVYTKRQALEAVRMLQRFLVKQDMTYKTLVNVALPLVERVNMGQEILILSAAFIDLSGEIPIDACDKDIILALLTRIESEIMAVNLPIR